MNRLQNSITPYSIVNSIKQEKHKGSLIFVEGQSDYNFWIKFKDKSSKIEITYGFPNLLEIVNLLNRENYEPKYIGIIDADFRRLDNEIPENQAVFVTDEHDLETTLMHSEALDRVINFYCKDSQEKKNSFLATYNKTILEILLHLALPIACFKKLKKEKNYSFKFKPTPTDKKEENLKYTEFIDKEKMIFLGYEQLIIAIKNYTRKYISKETNKNKITEELNIDNKQLKEQIIEIENKKFPIMQLCNGHDLVNILAIMLMKAISNYDSKYISPQEIEDKLVAYYDSSDLKKTNLYSSIKQWEISHNRYRFLAI